MGWNSTTRARSLGRHDMICMERDAWWDATSVDAMVAISSCHPPATNVGACTFKILADMVYCRHRQMLERALLTFLRCWLMGSIAGTNSCSACQRACCLSAFSMYLL